MVTRFAKAWNTSAVAVCVERLALEGGPAGERQVKDHFQIALTQHECLHDRFQSLLCGTEDSLRAADGAAAVKEKLLLPGHVVGQYFDSFRIFLGHGLDLYFKMCSDHHPLTFQ